MDLRELSNTFDYIHAELNRIETMAGTLSSVERNHFNRLNQFEQDELRDIAVEEQSAARQLGAMKEICLALAQKVSEMKQAVNRGETGEAAGNAQAH